MNTIKGIFKKKYFVIFVIAFAISLFTKLIGNGIIGNFSTTTTDISLFIADSIIIVVYFAGLMLFYTFSKRPSSTLLVVLIVSLSIEFINISINQSFNSNSFLPVLTGVVICVLLVFNGTYLQQEKKSNNF
ncbi:MAG: hypothetical protein RBT19_05845 [Tenuifilaceae bacterium]|jgi:hypothetical protein|nr:hypothetical protein [Tenuifilaceae bacterium]